MALEQHVITSVCGNYTRDIWLLPGPTDQAHRLCVFLDGEFYIRDVQSVPVIQAILEAGAIPPMTCLFVSHASGEARHHDYTCNDQYGKFIGEDVVTWAKERTEHVKGGDHLICGLSLSGLAAAYTALRYPSVFSYSLCQSGSFWWLGGKDIALPPTKAKFWLSVGNEETTAGVSHPPTGLFQQVSQIEGVENAVKALEELGATVRYSLYSGGHGFAPWREELLPALKWLIGTISG